MAGALGFALAGPRRYGGVLVEDAVMGAGGRRELGAADIRRALRLYWIADGLLLGAARRRWRWSPGQAEQARRGRGGPRGGGRGASRAASTPAS